MMPPTSGPVTIAACEIDEDHATPLAKSSSERICGNRAWVAGPMNETPKYVVSTSLTEPLAWQNSTLIRDDVAGSIRRLKEEDGKNIQVIGSGELVQTLIREGLVDEYQLMVHPIVLGTGKKLFRDGADTGNLELIESKATTTGVLLLRYRPAA